MIAKLLRLGAVLMGCLATAHAAEPLAITVHADRPAHRISPTLHGIFFEDINYGADGGLYAELVQNRSFEFQGQDALFAWSKVERPGGAGDWSVATERPLNANNPHYLRLQIQQAGRGVGVVNGGWGGVAVRKGERYAFTVHARAGGDFTGALEARLETAAGKSLGACPILGVTSEWRKFTGTLIASATDTNARVVLLANAPGTVDLDMVSLFPENTFKHRPNGLRADLGQLLADLQPAFLRFPGGCIVEGKDLANRYAWKDTIGEVAARKGNWNRWQSALKEAPAPQYYQSYGLGFFEFFQLCEDLGCEPLPILGCGMSCQFQDKELVPVDQLQPFIQDALDLVEFANGPASSPWGARRAALGHPAPFHLKFLGIGNEQWGQPYFDRYPVFHRALKVAHPEIQLVSSAGPAESGEWFDFAWPRLRALPADIVDEHYYMPPQWFLDNTRRYDHYPRTGPKVFAGEYAAHTAGWGGDNRNNLLAALSEAAFLTGLERNSDVVVMASYAPLFARLGNVQWGVDLIWFNNTAVYASPSYYVQQLFSRNRGGVLLPTEIADHRPPPPPAGRIGLCTYHTDAEFKDVRVTRNGQTLFASTFDRNVKGWKTAGGSWAIGEGAYRQSDTNVVATSLAGDPAWSDYTLTLKARKLGGDEGFIVLVRNSARDHQVQWNLGGWGNQKHGLQILAGAKSQLVAQVPGSIETGRWYDLKIELHGVRLEAYLDGQLLQSADIPGPATPRLFATASRETESGDILLKVVNPTAEPAEAALSFAGCGALNSQAEVTTLTSARPTDENSLGEPRKVAPTTAVVEGIGVDSTQTFKPWSLTILRVKPKQ